MAADPRDKGPKTYISTLITPADAAADGLAKTSDGPLFMGNVVVKTAIIFPDGTTQASSSGATSFSGLSGQASVAQLPNLIDIGTF